MWEGWWRQVILYSRMEEEGIIGWRRCWWLGKGWWGKLESSRLGRMDWLDTLLQRLGGRGVV